MCLPLLPPSLSPSPPISPSPTSPPPPPEPGCCQKAPETKTSITLLLLLIRDGLRFLPSFLPMFCDGNPTHRPRPLPPVTPLTWTRWWRRPPSVSPETANHLFSLHSRLLAEMLCRLILFRFFLSIFQQQQNCLPSQTHTDIAKVSGQSLALQTPQTLPTPRTSRSLAAVL